MSSKRAIRRNACLGKKRYETFVEARKAMFGLIRAVGNGGWPMSAYRCVFCGGFHFGHIPVRIILGRKGKK